MVTEREVETLELASSVNVKRGCIAFVLCTPVVFCRRSIVFHY